jgi:hypothetical protein
VSQRAKKRLQREAIAKRGSHRQVFPLAKGKRAPAPVTEGPAVQDGSLPHNKYWAAINGELQLKPGWQAVADYDQRLAICRVMGLPMKNYAALILIPTHLSDVLLKLLAHATNGQAAAIAVNYNAFNYVDVVDRLLSVSAARRLIRDAVKKNLTTRQRNALWTEIEFAFGED